MSRRDLITAVILAALLALNYWQARQNQAALESIRSEMSAERRMDIAMHESRIIVLEKAIARMEGEMAAKGD